MRLLSAEKDTKIAMNTEHTSTAATVAEHAANVAPEKATSKKAAPRKKGAPKGQKTTRGAKGKAASPKKEAKSRKKVAKSQRKAAAPRSESKGAKILELVIRAKGATLGEIMKLTKWQGHSVRGFISTAAKKHGLKIKSAKNEAGDRVYKIGA
jgi:hypothetical protein